MRPCFPIALILLLCDIAYIHYYHKPRIENDIRSLTTLADTNENITLQGRISYVKAPIPANYNQLKYRFTLKDLTYVKKDGQEVKIKSNLGCVWYGKELTLGGFAPEPNLIVELSGTLYSRESAIADDASLENFVFVSRASNTLVLKAPLGEAETPITHFRDNAAKILTLGLQKHPIEASLILAQTLGLRGEIPRNLTYAFKHAGTIHIFAISGLHVIVIAQIILLLATALSTPKRLQALVLAPLLIIYIIMTGAQPSALRAGIMAITHSFATLFGRKSDPLNTFSFTLLLLLISNPLLITETGFILSFGMVAGLITFTPTTIHLLNFLKPTPTKPLAIRQNIIIIKIRDFIFKTKIFAIDLLAVSLTAAIVSLPLTAYFFGYLTTYSILANLLVVPLSHLVMLLASLSLIISTIYPPLAIPTNLCAAFGAYLMEKISIIVTKLPYASINIQPSPIHIFLLFLLLFIIRYAINQKGKK